MHNALQNNLETNFYFRKSAPKPVSDSYISYGVTNYYVVAIKT